MTNLQEMIETLEQAQKALETIEEWKKIMFEETDFYYMKLSTAEKETPIFIQDAYDEVRNIMGLLGIGKEWKQTSEVYQKYHNNRKDGNK